MNVFQQTRIVLPNAEIWLRRMIVLLDVAFAVQTRFVYDNFSEYTNC